MLGDPLGTITRNFECMREDQGLADRSTFIVDPEGVIQALEMSAEGIGRNATDLVRKIKAAQYATPSRRSLPHWQEEEKRHLRLLSTLLVRYENTFTKIGIRRVSS